MIREADNDISRVTAYFVTSPQVVNEGQDVDLEAIVADLNSQLENWNGRGSGFVVERITRFIISIVKYRPLHGSNSSFIPTPPYIERKKCTVNVKNDDDEYCFMWAVLSALYPSKTHKNKVFTYKKHTSDINLKGLSFPLAVKDIAKFEKINPKIAINVLYWEADDSNQQQQRSEFTIEYLSPERERQIKINLLLLQDDVSSKRHYVWISDISRLVAGRTKYDGKTYVCNSCLQPFSNQRVLDNHIPFCIKHSPQQVVYPNPDDPKDCTLTFGDFQRQHKIPFYLVCDLETFLAPLDIDDEDRNMRRIDEHRVSGFCCYRVTDYTQYQTPPRVYSGDNVMDTFYNHIISESDIISQIIREQRPMAPPSPEELEAYKKVSVCGNCGEGFTHKNHIR